MCLVIIRRRRIVLCDYELGFMKLEKNSCSSGFIREYCFKIYVLLDV